MEKKTWLIACKHCAYALMLLLLFLIQEAPSVTLFGVRGVPVAGLFVAVAMLEDEMAGAFFGLAAGILCDTASAQVFGVASVLFLVLGCTVGLLVMYMVNSCPRSALLMSGTAGLLYGLVTHYLLYGFWDYAGSGVLLLTQTLPSALLTAGWGFLLYYAVRGVRDAIAARIGS